MHTDMKGVRTFFPNIPDTILNSPFFIMHHKKKKKTMSSI